MDELYNRLTLPCCMYNPSLIQFVLQFQIKLILHSEIFFNWPLLTLTLHLQTFSAYHKTWPQMTSDLGMWPLTYFTYNWKSNQNGIHTVGINYCNILQAREMDTKQQNYCIGKIRRAHSTFFSGRGVRPGFLKCGACELIFTSERRGLVNWISKYGGLWTDNFQIWGLSTCQLKISKFEAWELKFGKVEAEEGKISKFSQISQMGSCELTLLFELDLCKLQERCEKGLFRATHPHIPFPRSVPPR